ncbi:hypothetical protein HWV07_15465 [Natronomonas salina]|uniref:HalOD1 output domain-containing protein n=1 Tax=Natronomonas salina TaxID=1710540 RepID=UPI0015B50500|nr:HalOD1 output domain-containing protein [Natronomonas salina]QLD90358.1 hypothetical protein HWV07_15465 [Natronomonas salina]
MGSETRQEHSSTESVVVTILSEIAQREGDPPQELSPPLYDVIDPDVLETLFGNPSYNASRDTITLEFTYLNYRIAVRGPEDIEICAI